MSEPRIPAEPKLPWWRVVWEDAHGSSTEEVTLQDPPHSPVVVISYGYLLRNDEAGITVASEYTSNNTYRSYSFIPRRMVIEAASCLFRVSRPARRKAVPPPPKAEDTPQLSPAIPAN